MLESAEGLWQKAKGGEILMASVPLATVGKGRGRCIAGLLDAGSLGMGTQLCWACTLRDAGGPSPGRRSYQAGLRTAVSSLPRPFPLGFRLLPWEFAPAISWNMDLFIFKGEQT